MAYRLSIEELCARHGNEDTHAAYVTRLALTLFDRLRDRLHLDAADRPLLAGAARLHDVGSGATPADHCVTGAMAIMAEGLNDFSPNQRRYVAAAVLLHGPLDAHLLAHPLVRACGNRQRLLRLAALLRVAEGLDHGHLQNASIRAVRCQATTVKVAVDTPGYGGTVAWANAKADLWPLAFGGAVRFSATRPRTPSRLYDAIVTGAGPTLDTLRRILFSQFCILGDGEAGALAGENPDYLHDMRVAIRRFRAGLRLFRPRLKGSPTPAILDQALADVADALGPCRDTDVWVAFAESMTRQNGRANDPAWQRWIECQRAHRGKDLKTLRHVIEGRAYAALKQDIGRFLRTELPHAIRRPSADAAIEFMSQRLTKGLHGLRRAIGPRPLTPEELHELRRRCRRQRYWAEFAAPLLGRRMDDLVLRLKAAADVLGDIHDADVYLERLAAAPDPPPPGLIEQLEATRRERLAAFSTTWRRLQAPKLQTQIDHLLARARQGG